MTDPNTQRRIVAAVTSDAVKRIVEIGPGRGALTEGLLELGVPLVVIEKDLALARIWSQRAKAVPGLVALQADALEVSLDQFGPPSETAVVGNIPYNITTPLIFHLIKRPRPFELVLMVQKEVADRLVAVAGASSYGALTIGLQSVASVERLFVVPRTVFRPQPRVDSAVVRIRPLSPPPLTAEHENRLRVLVRACFGWRRKQLGTTLRKHPELVSAGLAASASEIPAVLARAGSEPTARPETLSPLQFVELARSLAGDQPPETAASN